MYDIEINDVGYIRGGGNQYVIIRFPRWVKLWANFSAMND